MPNSFKAYILARRATDGPAGDLVSDIKRDPAFPDDVGSLSELRGHLRRRSACREALAAAETVWRQFRQHRKKCEEGGALVCEQLKPLALASIPLASAAGLVRPALAFVDPSAIRQGDFGGFVADRQARSGCAAAAR